ncbi:Thioredoxin H-type 1 [Bienertia sinuspersici]
MAEQVVGCHNVDQWKEQFEASKSAGKLVVVDFTASWCGPCRFIAPILADLAKKHPSVLFLKVDVDELKTVAEEFKVDAMPTFVFLKNGEEIDRVVGARKESLIELVVKHSSEAPPSASE